MRISFLFLIAFFLTSALNAQHQPLRIVLDAGHGGKDPGKEGSRRFEDEKNLNLALTQKLGDRIRKELPNVKLYFTRTNDRFVSLDDRVNFANRLKADYFLSVHCNSNPIRGVKGAKSHIHSKKNKDARLLATLIQQEIQYVAKRTNRGIQDTHDRGENLFVLQHTKMPSVLVETGFLSNPEDEKFLNSKHGQHLVVQAMFNGIRKFISYRHPYIDNSPTYKVQILATRNRVRLDSPHFQRLGMTVEEKKVKKNNQVLYKYMVGTEKSSDQAKQIQKKVRKKGFNDAFVVKVR